MHLGHIHRADDPGQKPPVRGIHHDDDIIFRGFGIRHPVGTMPPERDSVPMQRPFRRRIDVVPLLFVGHSRRINPHLLKPSLPDHILKDKLRHRAPADVPVADEKYTLHIALNQLPC